MLLLSSCVRSRGQIPSVFRGAILSIGLFLCLAIGLTLGLASPALAGIRWSVETSLPQPTQLGDRLQLDITLRNDGRLQGVGASVYGYDVNLLRLRPEESILSQTAIVQFPREPGFGFGGLDGNTALPLRETGGASPGAPGQSRFFEGRQLQRTFQTGELDISPITNQAGGPQFRIVFEVIGIGTTPLFVGSNGPGDAAVSISGVFTTSEDAALMIATPEPASGVLLGLGLALLANRRRLVSA